MKLGKHFLTPSYGDIKLTDHKSFEWQFEFLQKASDMCGNSLFGYTLELTHARDHAGISLTFSIKKLLWLNINIHDHRHWNELKRRWMMPDDYN